MEEPLEAMREEQSSSFLSLVANPLRLDFSG
jgi:hypothetical protein